jgi:hypothetical protein
MITGFNHLTVLGSPITASRKQWLFFIIPNFHKLVNLLVSITPSNNLYCVVCKNLDVNFDRNQLASHYKTMHRKQTTDYYLNILILKTPTEIKNMIEVTQH